MLVEYLLLFLPFLSRRINVGNAVILEGESRRFETHRFGVWELVVLAEPSILKRILFFQVPSKEAITKFFSGYLQYIPYLIRFVTEVYQIAPTYLLAYGFKHLWKSIEDGLSLYYTSQLLDAVSSCSSQRSEK